MIRLADRTILQTLPFPKSGASYTGLCLSPDGKKVYMTDTDNRICVADIDANNVMSWTDPIIMPEPAVGGSPFPGGLATDEKGDKLYVTLSRNNTLAVISLKDNSVKQIPVEIAPYDVVLASESKAYVTNWGGRIPVEGESVYQVFRKRCTCRFENRNSQQRNCFCY